MLGVPCQSYERGVGEEEGGSWLCSGRSGLTFCIAMIKTEEAVVWRLLIPINSLTHESGEEKLHHRTKTESEYASSKETGGETLDKIQITILLTNQIDNFFSMRKRQLFKIQFKLEWHLIKRKYCTSASAADVREDFLTLTYDLDLWNITEWILLDRR